MSITNENIKEYVEYYLNNEKDKLPESIQNLPIGKWDVSNVTNMKNLFSKKQHFNEPLNEWNVSNVTNMSYMFRFCSRFNQPLNDWNVSNVKTMKHMFSVCSNFNQPLDNWDTSNVVDVSYMFYGCLDFNQSLVNWNIDNVSQFSFETMFEYSSNMSEKNKPIYSIHKLYKLCSDQKNKSEIIKNEFKEFENNPITIINKHCFIDDKCLYNQTNPYLIHYETFEGNSYPIISILKGTLMYTARLYQSNNQLDSYFHLYKLANNNTFNEYEANEYENTLTYFFPVPYTSFLVNMGFQRMDMVVVTKDIKLLALITPSPISRSIRAVKNIYSNVNSDSIMNCPSRDYDLCIENKVINGLKLNGYIGIANADSLTSNLNKLMEITRTNNINNILSTAFYKSSCLNNLINDVRNYSQNQEIMCRTIGIPEIVLIPYDIHNYPQDYENVRNSFLTLPSINAVDSNKFVFKYVDHIEGNSSLIIGNEMSKLLDNYKNDNKLGRSLQCPQLLTLLLDEAENTEYIKPFNERITFKDISFTDAYKNKGKCAFETPMYYLLYQLQAAKIGGKLLTNNMTKQLYLQNNQQDKMVKQSIPNKTEPSENNNKFFKQSKDFYYNEVDGIPILIITKTTNTTEKIAGKTKKIGGKTKKIGRKRTKKIKHKRRKSLKIKKI